ncbi:MAG: glycosyltransferase family 2 protein, partial [Anaeroplasmataceae bacterium]|nr:glycosyltransferase family 2 protein [Anaeroplasmataceae bacterium]
MDSNTAIIPVVIPSLEPDERFLKLLEDLYINNISPIIVINDGSGKNYNFYYEKAETTFHATILKHDINLGKGRSLKDAFSYCLDNYPNLVGCVTADSDGQHTLQSIMECKEKLKYNPASLILGARDFSQEITGIPLKSKVGNQLTCKIFQYLYGINISDTQTGLRGIPAGFMKYLVNIPGERFEFETQMLIETKHSDVPIIEMHIETIYDSKEHHSTHFNPIVDSVRIYKLFG